MLQLRQEAVQAISGDVNPDYRIDYVLFYKRTVCRCQCCGTAAAGAMD
jgi:hypothetical protein